MKTLKICLVILCLLHFRAVGLPRFSGATFFMLLKLNTRKPIYTTIDDEDYKLISGYRWRLGGGRQDRHYVVSTSEEGKQINLHRLIMGNPIGIVDHKDHNVLNNQKANLRVCTFAENIRNSRKLKPSAKSIYKGIMFNKYCGRWRAKIFSNGKTYELGYYRREVEAALAYNKAAIFHHGEFACLNDVEDIQLVPFINNLKIRINSIYANYPRIRQ
jgi:hypothetical protein